MLQAARALFALPFPIYNQQSRASLPGALAPCSNAGGPWLHNTCRAPERLQALATSQSPRSSKAQQAWLLCQRHLFYQFITLSLTVPIWFVRHSFPYSLLYLAHN